MSRKMLSAAVAATVVCALAVGASAQPQRAAGDAPRVLVHYADLNLSSASGRAQLAQRIAAAASSICGPAPSVRDLAGTQARRACMKATIASSSPTLDEAAQLQIRNAQQLAETEEH